MLVLLPSNWCANWWIQNNTVGESCHLEVSEFFHLDIQIFAHLQKNFVIFTPVEYRKIFLANCLDFNQPGKTGVFTNMVIHYTSVMEKMPRTNLIGPEDRALLRDMQERDENIVHQSFQLPLDPSG